MNKVLVVPETRHAVENSATLWIATHERHLADDTEPAPVFLSLVPVQVVAVTERLAAVRILADDGLDSGATSRSSVGGNRAALSERDAVVVARDARLA